MNLHIIYTEAGMLLSKHDYQSWREIQEEYADYKASLGPWSVEGVIEFLDHDYSNLLPAAMTQVRSFVASDAQACTITFDER